MRLGNFRYRARIPRQTVVPSQRDARRVPLVSGPLDTFGMLDNEIVGDLGQPKVDPFVLTAFDARPINCIDFIKTFTAAEQTAAAGARVADFSFRVPDSRVAIIRRVRMRTYIRTNGGPTARDVTTGAPGAEILASFLIDGNPVDQFNRVRVDESVSGVVTPAASDLWIFGDVEYNVYFLAPPGSVVTLRYELISLLNIFDFISSLFTGNLLMAKGLDIDSEPGTKRPLPIDRAGFDRQRFPRHKLYRGRVSGDPDE